MADAGPLEHQSRKCGDGESSNYPITNTFWTKARSCFGNLLTQFEEDSACGFDVYLFLVCYQLPPTA